MDDFEVHPVGTARRLAELEQRLNTGEFTDEEKADMAYAGKILDLTPEDEIPAFLKRQAD